MTCDAGERYVEVALEVLVARVSHVQRGIGHAHGAHLAARAPLVQVRDDVTRASDESEVGLDARADSHATVQRRGHENDALTGTNGAKLVVVAVLLAVARRRYNHPHHCHQYNIIELNHWLKHEIKLQMRTF